MYVIEYLYEDVIKKVLIDYKEDIKEKLKEFFLDGIKVKNLYKIESIKKMDFNFGIIVNIPYIDKCNDNINEIYKDVEVDEVDMDDSKDIEEDEVDMDDSKGIEEDGVEDLRHLSKDGTFFYEDNSKKPKKSKSKKKKMKIKVAKKV